MEVSMRSLTLLFVFLASASASEPESMNVDQAAQVLSAHPRGLIPDTAQVKTAIDVLGRDGGPAEEPILREVIEHEMPEIAGCATRALALVHERTPAVPPLAPPPMTKGVPLTKTGAQHAP
jgi:hypothetical protein